MIKNRVVFAASPLIFSFASSPAASYFSLDGKVAKPSPSASSLIPLKNNNKLLIPQGLDLMLAIPVETSIAATQVFRRRVGTERVALLLVIERLCASFNGLWNYIRRPIRNAFAIVFVYPYIYIYF